MGNNFGQYDPGRVSLVAVGIEITGFHSGTFITVARNVDTFSHEKGGQGDGVRTRSRDKSGYIEFVLQATAPANKLLLRQALLDESTGRGYGPSIGKDADGNGMIHADKSWVVKPADLTWADEHTPRTWRIACDDLDFIEQAEVLF